jgi:hypothetical protein
MYDLNSDGLSNSSASQTISCQLKNTTCSGFTADNISHFTDQVGSLCEVLLPRYSA